jgi:hypothetical protein
MTRALARRRLKAGRIPTFTELRVMFKESKRESEREWKEIHEMSKENEKLFKEYTEWFKKYELSVKDNNKQYGEMGRRYGELVEHLVRPGIKEKFNEMGYHLKEVDPKFRKIRDENGVKMAEIDILLENAETVMAVEVKSKPNNEDVEDHVTRLEIMREYRDKENDKRKIHGAIAGAIFKDEVKKVAKNAGFYVIEQSGDTMKIDVPEGWVPKAW